MSTERSPRGFNYELQQSVGSRMKHQGHGRTGGCRGRRPRSHSAGLLGLGLAATPEPRRSATTA
jgi:hypothetical protein